MNKEQEGLIELVGQEYTKWFYDNAVPSVSGKPILNGEGILTKGGFISKCKTNPEFAKQWGLQIEERELSFEERHLMYCKSFKNTDDNHKGSSDIDKMTKYHNNRNIPTKLITVTYNNKTIESYE
jgi:hypothetical protein